MAVKYTCKECEKKFIDWGAEKLGFKCPDCEDSPLELIDFQPAAKAKAKKKPALKRKAKKVTAKKIKVEEEAPETVATADGEEVVLEGFSVTDGSEETSD